MTTARLAEQLAAVLVPLGFIGAALAVVCAIVAAVAIVRGAGGLVGGAIALWIPSAMLSGAASFSSQWVPLLISGVALVAMLMIGGVLRSWIGARPAAEAVRAETVTRPAAAAPSRPAPALPSLATATATVATVATGAAKAAAGQR